MVNLKKLKYSILILLLFGCGGINNNVNVNNNSFIMEEVYTYPEERHVLQAVPVVPVEIKELNGQNSNL
jgi:hypothetical protein